MAFTWQPQAAVTMSDITTSPANKILAYIYNSVLSAAGNSLFKWQVVTYQTTSPAYLMLSRKDGTAGRILIFGQTGSTPATAATYAPPTAGGLYISYSPSSTSNTITTSYLTGVPLADVDFIRGIGLFNGLLANSTRTDYRLVIYDSSPGIIFVNTNPGLITSNVCFAGELMLDTGNTPISCVSGSETSQAGVAWPYQLSDTLTLIGKASSAANTTYTNSNPILIARINGANYQLYRSLLLSSSATINLLYDNASGQTWFLPQVFNGPTDFTNLGIVGRLRQMAYGPVAIRDAIYTDNATGLPSAYPVTPNPTTANNAFWILNKDI